MPQLQFADYAPQLIWLAITFVVLYFALSRAAIPRIEHVLETRKSRIDGDLGQARAAQKQAEEEILRRDTQIAAAKAKGQAFARARRETLDAELAEKRKSLDREAAVKAAETEADIRSFVEQASKQMHAATKDVVSDIVKEIAGVDASESEVMTALRQATKD